MAHCGHNMPAQQPSCVSLLGPHINSCMRMCPWIDCVVCLASLLWHCMYMQQIWTRRLIRYVSSVLAATFAAVQRKGTGNAQAVLKPLTGCWSSAAVTPALHTQAQRMAAENDKLRGEIRLLRGEQQALAAEMHGWQARWQASVMANRNLMEHLCLTQPQAGLVSCPVMCMCRHGVRTHEPQRLDKEWRARRQGLGSKLVFQCRVRGCSCGKRMVDAGIFVASRVLAAAG